MIICLLRKKKYSIWFGLKWNLEPKAIEYVKHELPSLSWLCSWQQLAKTCAPFACSCLHSYPSRDIAIQRNKAIKYRIPWPESKQKRLHGTRDRPAAAPSTHDVWMRATGQRVHCHEPVAIRQQPLPKKKRYRAMDHNQWSYRYLMPRQGAHFFWTCQLVYGQRSYVLYHTDNFFFFFHVADVEIFQKNISHFLDVNGVQYYVCSQLGLKMPLWASPQAGLFQTHKNQLQRQTVEVLARPAS